MPNSTYGGVGGRGAKAKTLASRTARFLESPGDVDFGLLLKMSKFAADE